MPKLINTMMELRKCCNHPYLINGAEEQILSEQQQQQQELNNNNQLKAMIQSCGKLVLVDKLLPKLKANGNFKKSEILIHRICLFSVIGAKCK